MQSSLNIEPSPAAPPRSTNSYHQEELLHSTTPYSNLDNFRSTITNFERTYLTNSSTRTSFYYFAWAVLFAGSIYTNGELVGLYGLSILIFFTLLRVIFLTKIANPTNTPYTIVPIGVMDIIVIVSIIVTCLSSATNPMVLFLGFMETPSTIVVKLCLNQPLEEGEPIFFAFLILQGLVDPSVFWAVIIRALYRLVLRNRFTSSDIIRINLSPDFVTGFLSLGFILLFFFTLSVNSFHEIFGVMTLMAINISIETVRYYLFSMIEKYKVEEKATTSAFDLYSAVTFCILTFLDFSVKSNVTTIMQKSIEAFYVILIIWVNMTKKNEIMTHYGMSAPKNDVTPQRELLIVEEHN